MTREILDTAGGDLTDTTVRPCRRFNRAMEVVDRQELDVHRALSGHMSRAADPNDGDKRNNRADGPRGKGTETHLTIIAEQQNAKARTDYFLLSTFYFPPS